MFRKPRANPTQEAGGKIGHAPTINAPQAAECERREFADYGIQGCDQAPSQLAAGWHLEHNDDFAEHLPAFDTREPALVIGKRHFEVDHWC